VLGKRLAELFAVPARIVGENGDAAHEALYAPKD
jgi:hypothetical protein